MLFWQCTFLPMLMLRRRYGSCRRPSVTCSLATPMDFSLFLGDFNQANLKTVLPKLHLHVEFPTRGDNILDLVYTNTRSVCRATPHPHIGLSDHITVVLTPTYMSLLKREKPVTKQVRTWPGEAIEALQDCTQNGASSEKWRPLTIKENQ